MMKLKYIFLIAIFYSSLVIAQVGIGTIAPDASSALDIESTTAGLLIPRVTLAERALIQDPMTAEPATGLLVYQTDNTPGFYYYDSTMWVMLGGVGGSGDITTVFAGAGITGGGATGDVTVTAAANNGINVDAVADRIQLGGPLVENTTITPGTNTLAVNLTSTGDFHVQIVGTNQFSVLDNGDVDVDANTLYVDSSTNRVGVGTNAPTTTLDIDGNVRIRGGAPTAGAVLVSQDVNGTASWSTDGFGLVPIGSIVAWHGNIGGSLPALPAGWVECTGGTVADADSPINGRPIPDLNSNTTATSGDTSRGRFLRGSTTSGLIQADVSNNLQQIDHDDDDSGVGGGSSTTTIDDDGSYSGYFRNYGTNDSDEGRMRVRHEGVETRVTNMSVRWIMRIK